MFSVKNLHVTLNDRYILGGINLDLEDGESLVILGSSGVGKSVFLKSVLGLIPIKSGNIFIKGVDITKAKEKKRLEALSNIGMLFQSGALFDSLPVWKNIAFGLIYGKRMKVEKAKKIALEKMELVDLEADVAELFPASLSGGMQKRVGLARALALNPEIIFFDEPTTGLDPITSNIVNQLIIKSVKCSGIGAITITHDLNCLRRIADTVAFLYDGKIVWRGKAAEIDTTNHPKVRQFVKGESGPFNS
jgi:phospholipid/cholesterol/gamma-HCH transport system ATP-binding protein